MKVFNIQNNSVLSSLKENVSRFNCSAVLLLECTAGTKALTERRGATHKTTCVTN